MTAPAFLRKLKTLKRLNPHKTDEELLAQISDGKVSKSGKKKGWFSLH